MYLIANGGILANHPRKEECISQIGGRDYQIRSWVKMRGIAEMYAVKVACPLDIHEALSQLLKEAIDYDNRVSFAGKLPAAPRVQKTIENACSALAEGDRFYGTISGY